MHVSKILAETGKQAKKDLNSPVQIEKPVAFPEAPGGLYTEKRIWKMISDVVVVCADLKNSTKLSFRQHPQGSARLYEAVTGNMVRIVNEFEPEFVAIQGDGLFALYHGDGPYARGLCAAITLKSFSAQELVPAIQSSMAERYHDTRLKLGMAAGILAAKNVGIRGTNEPVWAGKPVNWAFKCAGVADRNQLIVTRKVFQKFENNDYVTHSCNCGKDEAGERVPGAATPSELWTTTQGDVAARERPRLQAAQEQLVPEPR